jgi:hypothetical protein
MSPYTFCNDRLKDHFYVDSEPQRETVAAWVRANYVNRPQNQFDEHYDRHHNYANAPTYNTTSRFYNDYDTPERFQSSSSRSTPSIDRNRLSFDPSPNHTVLLGWYEDRSGCASTVSSSSSSPSRERSAKRACTALLKF